MTVAVIGGGPAGLAAALSAYKEGADVVLLERNTELGGILPQCIHVGFGNFIFGEMLTGPEYAQKYIDKIKKTYIDIKLGTMVLDISGKKITAVNKKGLMKIDAQSIVLAMGCRERTRSQIRLPGDRPSGIFTAGVAQRYINMEGLLPGKNVVILGSGDVGLIMARRFTLEGAHVEGVYEILPHPGGLTRNVVQCLHDYDIPLHLTHTITNIKGKNRVKEVTVAKVDENWDVIPGTERNITCDTVILSVGLIPENELSKGMDIPIDSKTGGPIVDENMETMVPGVFACGNVVHVHDLVDDVSKAADIAGKSAAQYVKGGIIQRDKPIYITPGKNVLYAVPHIIRGANKAITIYIRVKKTKTDVKVVIKSQEEILSQKKVRIVRPPEMVTVNITPDLLPSAKDEIKIDIDE